MACIISAQALISMFSEDHKFKFQLTLFDFTANRLFMQPLVNIAVE